VWQRAGSAVAQRANWSGGSGGAALVVSGGRCTLGAQVPAGSSPTAAHPVCGRLRSHSAPCLRATLALRRSAITGRAAAAARILLGWLLVRGAPSLRDISLVAALCTFGLPLSLRRSGYPGVSTIPALPASGHCAGAPVCGDQSHEQRSRPCGSLPNRGAPSTWGSPNSRRSSLAGGSADAACTLREVRAQAATGLSPFAALCRSGDLRVGGAPPLRASQVNPALSAYGRP